MSGVIPSSAINLVQLGNLLAPASGQTHGAVFEVTLNNSTAQLNMVQLTTSLGYVFQAQAMRVDNSGGASTIVIKDIVAGWTENILANEVRTFQFLSVSDAQYTFFSSGSVKFQVALLDYPAFPDTRDVSGAATSVSILGQPIAVTDVTPSRVYTAGDAVAVAVGGTAVNAFNAASIATGAIIINPTSNAAQLFVDPVNVATTTEGSNGTCIALNAGDTWQGEAASGAISVNSAAAVGFIAYRW
jgi:hypothetical protein